MNNLPSFQIEVREIQSVTGLEIIHQLNINTCRICKTLHPDLDPAGQSITEKPKAAGLFPKQYYTKIASSLSSLSEQELVSCFSNLRICFKATRSEKNYDFHF